jgi:hypothetical protein
MRFFIPYADNREADRLWSEVRAALLDQGFPTTARRIQALMLGSGDSQIVLAVGMSLPDTEEPILIILEASNHDIYYACTPLQRHRPRHALPARPQRAWRRGRLRRGGAAGALDQRGVRTDRIASCRT